jgi:hypothetical protein
MAFPFHAPKDIRGPNVFRIYVDELGGPANVAKHLQVGVRTVYRWLADDFGNVPRAAVLALYWESKYGRSQIFTEQVNEIQHLYAQAQALARELVIANRAVAELREFALSAMNEGVYPEAQNWRQMPLSTFVESGATKKRKTA